MSVVIDMQNTGDQSARTEVVAMIEHVLCDRESEWRGTIVGSRATADWEMKVEGSKVEKDGRVTNPRFVKGPMVLRDAAMMPSSNGFSNRQHSTDNPSSRKR